MTENEIGKVVVDAAIAVHKPLGVLSVLARWKKSFHAPAKKLVGQGGAKIAKRIKSELILPIV
jgi:hypothetical protein